MYIANNRMILAFLECFQECSELFKIALEIPYNR